MKKKLSDLLEYSTVRIECDNGRSVGTGFFYSIFSNDNENQIPFIVTNKHVINDATKAIVYIHVVDTKTGKEENHIGIDIGDVQKQFFMHPDSDVDLCAIPVGPVLSEIYKMGKEPKLFYFDDKCCYEKHKSKNSLGGLEEVYMTGYPNGLWDHENNKPITRKGITATNIKSDWQGKKEFLIDMACFPGSSGSPVYIYNDGTFTEGESIVAGTRLILLGILYAGPQIVASGEIKVVDVPAVQKAYVTTNMMLNLGIIIKAEKLDFLMEKFGDQL
ncbi:trypsin-like peptidase domain-containing protein [Pectobacterium brasiliense]|uniref:S1 family peptidase n=1 Tax=Pectobacterium brasiliense TaxID=180957 RepID=UPI001968FDE4|nr:serine protease [Pectobacterium brasiliense]MBN3175962.1 trypsin-like peptidase domain-containing protein [Pectobacterium brasiliense]MBN3257028.1 trypsin-like peptidase domain-containing protein [Pectobacterium brasiliense]